MRPYSTHSRSNNVSEADAWYRQTVWEHLLRTINHVPNKEFLVTVDSMGLEARVTYSEAAQKAQALSMSLFELGVRRGDRVALIMTNLVECVYIYLSTLRLGAILVPINTWFKDHEVEYELTHSGARHLILLDTFRQIDFTKILANICPEWRASKPGALFSSRLPDLRNIVVLQRDSKGRENTFRFQNAYNLSALLDRDTNSPFDPAFLACLNSVTPLDVAAIMYTSGSSGFPKGAMLEQWGLITASLLLGRRLEFFEHDKWFGAFPFFHVGGSVIGMMTTLAARATLVFTECHDAAFEVTLLERENCKFLAAVAAVVLDQLAILEKEDRTISVSTMMVNQLPDDTTQIRRRFGTTIFLKQYGLTEGYGRNSSTSPQDPVDLRVNTCGRVLDGIELRVINSETGNAVPTGEVGEALLKGLVMRGYFRPPETAAPAIDSEGWLHTQDLVSVDEDGFISYAGRLKAMLKVGGENVAAEEVEQCIRALPPVFDCCVVPIRDTRKGHLPLAYVSLRAGETLTADEIRSWCESRLARFKVPVKVEFLDALPLLGNNKVDRTALRARADSL